MSGYRFDRLKILVVDDNQHMRKLVVAILQAFGTTQIYEASNGARALVVMREENPDVVILDWMMDEMNGIEFTKEVRNSPTSPNPYVPIIMLTGHTSADCVQQARHAGAVDGRDRVSAALRPHRELFRAVPAPQKQRGLRRTGAPVRIRNR